MSDEKDMNETEKDLLLSFCESCSSMTHTMMDCGFSICGKCHCMKKIKCIKCGALHYESPYSEGLCDICFEKKIMG